MPYVNVYMSYLIVLPYLYVNTLKEEYFHLNGSILIFVFCNSKSCKSYNVSKLRPIYLLTVPAQLLEKALIGRIMHNLNLNNYSSSNQYSFTFDKNTSDALLEISSFN